MEDRLGSCKSVLVNSRCPGVLNPYWETIFAIPFLAPDKRPRYGLISQYLIDARWMPFVSLRAWDRISIKVFGYFLDTVDPSGLL